MGAGGQLHRQSHCLFEQVRYQDCGILLRPRETQPDDIAPISQREGMGSCKRDRDSKEKTLLQKRQERVLLHPGGRGEMKNAEGFGTEDNWIVECPNCGAEQEYTGFFDPDDDCRCRCGCVFRTVRVWLDGTSYIGTPEAVVKQ